MVQVASTPCGYHQVNWQHGVYCVWSDGSQADRLTSRASKFDVDTAVPVELVNAAYTDMKESSWQSS